jgi:hypothetical protein
MNDFTQFQGRGVALRAVRTSVLSETSCHLSASGARLAEVVRAFASSSDSGRMLTARRSRLGVSHSHVSLRHQTTRGEGQIRNSSIFIIIVTCMSVTIDGVWIGDSIY